jgi:hypothetical protein
MAGNPRGESGDMKSILVFLTVLFLALPAAAHKDNKTQGIITRYDAPMATTYYTPTGVPTVRDGNFRFKVYPYFGVKADGTIWFRLIIGLPYTPNSYARLAAAAITADSVTSELNVIHASDKQDGIFMRTFDIGGDLDNIVRSVGKAKDVWLIVTVPSNTNYGRPVRVNFHLIAEQIETFRMMVEKFDSFSSPAATDTPSVSGTGLVPQAQTQIKSQQAPVTSQPIQNAVVPQPQPQSQPVSTTPTPDVSIAEAARQARIAKAVREAKEKAERDNPPPPQQ